MKQTRMTAEIRQRMTTERIFKLLGSLRRTTEQLEHVEELRRKDCGPIPATLSPEIIEEAKRILGETWP